MLKRGVCALLLHKCPKCALAAAMRSALYEKMRSPSSAFRTPARLLLTLMLILILSTPKLLSFRARRRRARNLLFACSATPRWAKPKKQNGGFSRRPAPFQNCHRERSETLAKPMARVVEGSLLVSSPSTASGSSPPCAPQHRPRQHHHNSRRDSRPRLSAERSDRRASVERALLPACF